MKIWIVGVCDCEGNSIKCVCATKEIAERELFKARDELVFEFKKMGVFTEKEQEKFIKEKAEQGIHFGFDTGKENMYRKMITALSGNDYTKWDNYPHECPYIYETELLED